MNDDTREPRGTDAAGDLVQQLLEQLLESDRSVEQVCAAHPELIATVRARWLQLRHVAAHVDELFPAAPPAAPAATAPAAVPGYTIERELGRGGMGVVYRAQQQRLRRHVALKRLLTGQFATRVELLRFQREAELAAQLRHPNIVAIHDVGDVDGQPFFTMELVEGPSLAERLRTGPLAPKAAAALVATLARAVAFAHDHGIVHRDLKPANVLLAADGTPKISDFGLAQRIGVRDATITGARLGTPGYMAPEQATGELGAIGPATDVHALGVLLYELLVGVPPFRGSTPDDTARLVVESAPRAPRSVDRAIPRDLETICLRCLHKQPHRRYPSAAALADDLERFGAGAPIHARRVGALERTWLWSRRRPGLAAALGATAVLALALLAGGASVWTQRMRLLDQVAADLGAADTHARAARWTDARDALEAAATRLGTNGPDELRERVAAAREQLALVDRLELVRLQQSVVLNTAGVVRSNRAGAGRDYERLLAPFGLAATPIDVAAAAQRVRAASIAPALLAALDDWSSTVEPERRGALLAVARAVDPDPAWRDRVRDDAHWLDLATLRELARGVDLDAQPAALLTVLAERLQRAGGDAVPLLTSVHERHPQDFWLAHALGLLTVERRPAHALRYFQAALALRPTEPAAHEFVGLAACAARDLAAGEMHLRRAVALRGDDGWLRINLGNCLLAQRRFAAAAAEFTRAIALRPDALSPRIGLCAAQGGQKEWTAALATITAAEAIDGADPFVQGGIGYVLQGLGRSEEALDRHDRAVGLTASTAATSRPDRAELHGNRARTLHSLGRLDDAAAAARQAVALEPDDPTWRSLLAQLLGATGDTDSELAGHARACALPAAGALEHHLHGVALAIDWRHDDALVAFGAALELAPDRVLALAGVANTLRMQGRFEESRDATTRWLALAQRERGQHEPGGGATVERALQLQQAVDQLLALVAADVQPGDADVAGFDAACLAARAERAGDDVAALVWFTAAFAAPRPLGDDVRGAYRWRAVACALRVAVAASAGAEQRAARAKALEWLHSDLAFRRRTLPDVAPPVQRRLVGYARRLQVEARFASVRDAAALAGLPEDERAAWLEYWAALASWLASAPR